MKRKTTMICIGIIFMLVAITMVSVVSSNKIDEQKESPLYKIRSSKAIFENEILSNNIFSKFIQKRLFINSMLWTNDFYQQTIDSEENPHIRHFFNKDTVGLVTVGCRPTECRYPTYCTPRCSGDITIKATFICGSCTQNCYDAI